MTTWRMTSANPGSIRLKFTRARSSYPAGGEVTRLAIRGEIAGALEGVPMFVDAIADVALTVRHRILLVELTHPIYRRYKRSASSWLRFSSEEGFTCVGCSPA